MEKGNKKIECEVCGCKFEPIACNHYIARQNGERGLTTVISSQEVQLYDAFNCPQCGCQVVIKERKRNVDDDFMKAYDEDENEDEG